MAFYCSLSADSHVFLSHFLALTQRCEDVRYDKVISADAITRPAIHKVPVITTAHLLFGIFN